MGSQSSPSSCQSAQLMGSWVIDMTDLDAAHAAIALYKAKNSAGIEVRHTLWGVQIRTDSQSAAEFLTRSYSAPQVALAA